MSFLFLLCKPPRSWLRLLLLLSLAPAGLSPSTGTNRELILLYSSIYSHLLNPLSFVLTICSHVLVSTAYRSPPSTNDSPKPPRLAAVPSLFCPTLDSPYFLRLSGPFLSFPITITVCGFRERSTNLWFACFASSSPSFVDRPFVAVAALTRSAALLRLVSHFPPFSFAPSSPSTTPSPRLHVRRAHATRLEAHCSPRNCPRALASTVAAWSSHVPFPPLPINTMPLCGSSKTIQRKLVLL